MEFKSKYKFGDMVKLSQASAEFAGKITGVSFSIDCGEPYYWVRGGQGGMFQFVESEICFPPENEN